MSDALKRLKQFLIAQRDRCRRYADEITPCERAEVYRSRAVEFDEWIAALTHDSAPATCPNCCCDQDEGIHIDACCEVLSKLQEKLDQANARIKDLSEPAPLMPPSTTAFIFWRWWTG